MPVWFFGLLFAAFVFYTDDYVIAGVLPEIAAELGVHEGAAGQLVTVFSLTVAVSAPVMAIAAARWPRRLVFGSALPVFVCANTLAAITTSFEVLMLLRVLAALAAATATPALFSVAATLAPEGRQGRFIGTVALGVTGSIAVGVPIGTWIGGQWGWRRTFATMAVCGVLALLWLMVALPTIALAPAGAARPAADPGFAADFSRSAGERADHYRIHDAADLSRVLPHGLSGAGTDARAVIFAASGVAGMIGIWLGGVATDKWGPDRTLVGGICAFVGVMVLLTAFWWLRPVSLWIVAPLAVVWGGAAFWNSPAIQARLLGLAGPVGGQALAMNTSSTYVGVAIGGVLLSTATIASLPPVSAALGLAALGVFVLAERSANPSRGSSTTSSGAKRG